MHIAVVTRNMGAGGAERVIAQLLQSWVQHGIRCSLFCVDPIDPFYTVPNAVNCYNVPHFSEQRYMDKVRKYIYLRKILKKIKPDIVLALPEEIGIYVGLALLRTGIPLVVSERNNPWTMPYKKISRALRRVIYPFVDGFIFQTEQAASFFTVKQQKRGVILPNPLEIDRLPIKFEGKREKIIVGVGRLEYQKNFDMLINAFAEFYKTHQNYKLVIYGEGTLRKHLTEHIEMLSLPQGTITLPGKSSQVLQKINRAEIFVLSSDFEGMPNALIEAMACGIPCISTNCPSGGPADLIENGRNGFLVPVGNYKALSEKMAILADNQALAQTFSMCYKEIQERFQSKKVSESWLAYLKKISGKE